MCVLWQNHVSLMSLFCRIFCVKNLVLLRNKLICMHAITFVVEKKIEVEENIALMINKCKVTRFKELV